MAQTPPQMVVITCRNCGRQFTTQVYSIVDVGQNPEAKRRLLEGQTNVAVCPQCGVGGILSVPFLYHDPQKELLFIYTPPPTMMDNNRQQRFIGSLINSVMTSLPSERRKGYLFQPRTFLSLETMMDEIVIADGISRQQLEGQKRKAHLLDRLRTQVGRAQPVPLVLTVGVVAVVGRTEVRGIRCHRNSLSRARTAFVAEHRSRQDS